MSKAERGQLLGKVVVALAPPLILIVSVLGSTIAGIATPTESAAVGAVGAMVLALVKAISDRYFVRLAPEVVQRALFYFWLAVIGLLGILGIFTGGVGVLTFCTLALIICILWIAITPDLASQVGSRFQGIAESSLVITTMVFVIFFGASLFSMVFARLGGEALVSEFLASLPGGVNGAMLVVMLIMFVLGFFLDPFEIIFVVVPIAGPVLLNMGVDPIWLSVLIGVNLQTSYLTPPFGFSLFFLRGVAPPEIATRDIYIGILPFVGIQVLCMALIWFYPALATWLPKVIYG